ncbi:MAG: ATP-binding protein, partial [Gemmatimonadota bacterium]|nr:ATP-binding protein [Gemmatimonadota bacterium]
GELPSLEADPMQMRQLFQNLIGNALKFGRDAVPPRISVAAAGPGEQEPSLEATPEDLHYRITVRDNGIGFEEKHCDRIFAPFQRLHARTECEGTGMGLAICRRIVTWHDGRIWAESEEGGGARFVVSLPSRRATACGPVAGIVEMEPEETHRIPELIVEMISEVMGVDIVSLMLTDPSSEELHIHAAVGLPVEVVRDVRVGIGERICGVVARTGETLLIPDLAVDGRFESAHPTRYRTKSVLSTPVKIGGRVVGVLNVCDKRTGDTFTEHDRRLVELLSERVALILGKIREHARSPESLRNMENSLRCVIDVRRHYHPSGSDFDRTLLAVCGELDVPPREASLIHYAGMMRDIGMAKIPDGIYRRSTPLGSGGREIVERHPEEGAKALRPIEFLQDVFDIVISHHEGEGGGYPRGLPLGRIPRGGKILAVVDAYHALRSDRPHRKAEDREWALNTLREGVGTKYDGVVVEALARVLDANGSEGTNQSHGSGS